MVGISIELSALLNGRVIPTICRNGFPLFLPSEWLEEIDGTAGSPNTARTYAIQLRPFIQWLDDRGVPLEGDPANEKAKGGVSLLHLRQYRNELQRTSLNPNTVYQYVATAVRFCRWLGGPVDWLPIAEFKRNKRLTYTRGFLAGITRGVRNVETGILPRRRKSLPRHLTVEELNSIRSWVMAKWRDDEALQTLYRTVVEVAFAGALRRGELLSLRVSQIDLANHRLTVKIDVDKYNEAWLTGKELEYAAKGGEREVLLHPSAARWVRKWLTCRPVSAIRRGHDYLFCNLHPDREGEPLSPSALRHFLALLNRSRENGGVGLAKRVTVHIFRHSWATLMLEDGLPFDAVQHHLGHASPASTRIYTHVSDKKRREQLKTVLDNSSAYRTLAEEVMAK